jgi:hypothetical protein
MSDLELLADTMEEWSTTSGDHHMLAAAAIRQLIKLQAALQSGEPVVPEGYVLLPVEPTEAMMDAFMGRAVKYGWELEVDSPRDGYKAMLSAGKENNNG